MTVADVVAECLRREGVEYLFCYPYNPLIEAAAALDIRPIVARQERIAVHMADAYSRLHAGDAVGVVCLQYGPGAENAFGAVAQAYADAVPLVVLPAGFARDLTDVEPRFNASHAYRPITTHREQVTVSETAPKAIRRAFHRARNGRPGPALVEFPGDVLTAAVDPEEVPDYRPTRRVRSAPDPSSIPSAVDAIVAADRPVIYAGQGVHYAQAWAPLRALAERLDAPVCTSIPGKGAFPETHPLSLGTGGKSMPEPVHRFLEEADIIVGIGCSFSETNFGVSMPTGDRTIVHATNNPADVDKDLAADHVLLGDAKLVLEALDDELEGRVVETETNRRSTVVDEIERVRESWFEEWAPKLTADEVPLTPYRVINDLQSVVDVSETIITHDSGSPRDQLVPFWRTTAPLTYLGWGKSTQLGYGLGLTMGAKLVHPEKLCINVWGDAAIGMTGMDFETAVREDLPILSILFNNGSMAVELHKMQLSTDRYGTTDVGGNYAALAEALGGYGERIEVPEDIVPAIERGIERTEAGTPALLEFMTGEETDYSIF